MSKNNATKLMFGNEAVARGAWEAGCTVSTAYPGTPSTEISEYCLTYPEIKTEWSINEKVALEVGIGASLAGGRTLVSMKQVGVNVAADALFSLAYIGVNGGLVIVTADEPGLHSSQNEQDNRFYAKFAQIPMLEPSDSAEARQMTMMAFEMSEKYDTPVFLRMTTRICHSRGIVAIGERQPYAPRQYLKNPNKTAMVPSHACQRHFDLEQRQTMLAAASETFAGNRTEIRSLRFGVIASGISYQNAREALPEFSTLKIGMTYPVPHQLIRNFASQVEKLYIIEENRPFLEEEILALGIPVEGKQQLLRVGELSASALRRRILHQQTAQKPAVENLPKRGPQFCPGCLHRGIFYLLHKKKLIVSGDIGCYALACLPPYNAMDTIIDMGAGITVAQGFGKVIAEKQRIVGVMGDSTFFHSGMTGVANAVFNHAGSTFIILDNRITAMTGHQPDPATGRNITQKPTPRIEIAEVARALGVKRIRKVNAYDLAAMNKALDEETAAEETSLIIVEGPCVFTDRETRATPLAINPEKCTRCRLCFRLGCPAISMEGERVVILPDMCWGCKICSQVCPKSAIAVQEGTKQ